jgi:hypothetical protein
MGSLDSYAGRIHPKSRKEVLYPTQPVPTRLGVEQKRDGMFAPYTPRERASRERVSLEVPPRKGLVAWKLLPWRILIIESTIHLLPRACGLRGETDL